MEDLRTEEETADMELIEDTEQTYADMESIKEAKKNQKGSFLSSALKVFVGILIGFCLALLAGMAAIYYLQSNESSTAEESLADITEKMELLQEYIDYYYLFDEDYEAVAEAVYKAMIDALGDPYSAYYTAEEYEALLESSSGTYSGIGATVTKDEDTGYVRIVSLYEEGGAYESGIVADDLIMEVDGTDIGDLDLSSATAMMKGEEGTTVDVTVYRESTGETLSFTITRKQISVETVTYEMLDNNVGYILISSFDGVTTEQFEEALEELTALGMEALIVDLRDNLGGLLTTVNDIVDMLLPEGLIVYTEDKYGNRQDYYSDDEYIDVPLAVLVNGNSASASEIFAGAIQDHERGILVGTQTYGKGIVQTSRQLSDGSAIKLTVSRYYTPNGVCIHGEGITPDIVIEYDSEAVQDLDEVTWQDDNQLMAAYEALLEGLAE